MTNQPGALARDLLTETAIRQITARIIEAPTTRNHKLSNTSVTHQGYIFVTVTLENGVIGYGEGSTLGGPRWAEESVEAMKANIDAYLAPALIGQPACLLEDATLRMDRAAKRNYTAKSAIDMALLDALGKTLDVPAHVLLGGAVRTAIDAIWALASGDAAQEVDEAQAMLDRGWFKRFKIKLGFADPATDLARLAALQKALPSGTTIVADVNQGWSEAECIRYLPVLQDLGVSLIEQPIAAGQTGASARIAARSAIPIMMDESVSTLAEASREVRAATGTVLSLKLCKHGSLHNLKRVAGIAAAEGVQMYGGCLLESSIGAAGHLHVFATLPKLEWGTEQFGPKILVEDLVQDSLRYEGYQVHLPEGPGLGVTPDPEIIEKYARKD
ncbi:muconate/chloromuconate family cycloisomerase [Maritimibacter alkaliphilus]|uniref:muconate/chloromuconate family cycloisomerase n=1 Tax=Maritimibacter alkaliphilus TaxID=404236 RepID=UPI001C965335|nr:muconate/chloromuconate family cycloisomerase [Maritimibacter alkaliphilus]MBY6089316.1 muconate/chloromuconate family cycloisomerase [Maritimibacter alkaliphilus]